METAFTPGTRLLVVFDGRCGFCNGSVRWLARRDRLDRLRFAPSEDPHVSALLTAAHSSPVLNSLIVVRNARILIRSDAVLAALAELPAPWPSLAILLRAVPRPLRDLAYRTVARIRYRLGGRLHSCPLPSPAERAKFL